MNDLLGKLRKSQQRGSKPRCHWITHGTPAEVSARLTALACPFAEVAKSDHWMPCGFDKLSEAQFHRVANLLAEDQCRQIRTWWFRIYRGGLQTSPSFDIASTCTVDGTSGLLLVEAKAHVGELTGEERGKPLKLDASNGGRTNHDHIVQAIAWANSIFHDATGKTWQLSRDNRYQMSNRFAMACKLTSIGVPVVLVYLGFLNAKDMSLGAERPFASSDEWRHAVLTHSTAILPTETWDRRWELHGRTFAPLIRSVEIPVDRPCDLFKTQAGEHSPQSDTAQQVAPATSGLDEAAPDDSKCSLNGKHVLDDNMGAW
ncbi:hypothetical protein [Pseudorhodoplanes sp.]|uniref:hypothetical protein n=1 Tax=Pseudorhodoplanes sp. TaxID=1934341 RepID=UPI003D11D8A0